MVLNGQRLPSVDMVSRISRDLKLSPSDHRYLELIVELERNQRTGKPVAALLLELETFKKLDATSEHIIEAQRFQAIAEWQHLVIRQLIAADGFANRPELIAKKLRNKITGSQVSKAIQTLLAADSIKLQKDGRLILLDQAIRTKDDVPQEAARLHHQQMLERAKEALAEQDVNEREFSSTCLGFDVARISEAKEDLRAFVNSFKQKYTNYSTGSVAQLNIQLFQHTQTLKPATKSQRQEVKRYDA